jgi:hypothetical protein
MPAKPLPQHWMLCTKRRWTIDGEPDAARNEMDRQPVMHGWYGRMILNRRRPTRGWRRVI